MTLIRRRKILRGFWGLAVALVGLSLFSVLATAQQGTNTGTALRPGIVFDPNVNVAYVMTPEGIAAIDIATGAKRWTSTAAAKPLAIVGNLLISQVEPRTARSRLELVALDTQERGTVKVRSAAELPSVVRVSVGQTLEGKFSVEARPAGTDAIVVWSFERLPIRGLLPDPEEDPDNVRVTAGPGRSAQQYTQGALEIDLTTGSMRPVSTVMSTPAPRRWIMTASEKITGAAANQYESADGRHSLASELVADDRVWDKYRWTVFARATNNRLGEFRTHLSFTPFVVRDSTLVYETTPYIRAGRAEPAKLRGVSLSSGQEAWSVEVRELVYRGPYPP